MKALRQLVNSVERLSAFSFTGISSRAWFHSIS
jgi:hypothetical protein